MSFLTAVLWPFIKPILPYLLAAVALVALLGFGVHRWHVYQDSLRAEGRAEVQAKWDADALRRQKMVTDMAMLWNTQRERADALSAQLESKTHDLFAEVKRNAALVRRAAVVLPADLASSLRDSAHAANGGSGEGAPAVGAGSPATIALPGPAAAFDSQALASWGAEAAAAYADAVGQWRRCVREYDALGVTP